MLTTYPDMSSNGNLRRNVTIVTTPGVWTVEDSENFHRELSRHTEISNMGELILNHNYFGNQDIQVIEKAEQLMKPELDAKGKNSKYSRTYIVYYLEARNDSVLETGYLTMYDLVLHLQEQTGYKFTSKQLNTKHINTRSRISVPFASLRERGYFSKAIDVHVAKNISKLEDISNINYRFSNMDVKNLPIIKALYMYMTRREMFWCDETNRAAAKGSCKDSSEVTRWISAMVAQHGMKMLVFLDECVVNLLNSYLVERIEDDRYDDGLPVITKRSSPEDKRKVFLALMKDLGATNKQREENGGLAEAKAVAAKRKYEKAGGREAKKQKQADLGSGFNSVMDWVAAPGYDSGLATIGEQILKNAGVEYIQPGNPANRDMSHSVWSSADSLGDIPTDGCYNAEPSYQIQPPSFDLSNIF